MHVAEICNAIYLVAVASDGVFGCAEKNFRTDDMRSSTNTLLVKKSKVSKM